jgi:membrane protein DedA with SNARE-associated domain
VASLGACRPNSTRTARGI